MEQLASDHKPEQDFNPDFRGQQHQKKSKTYEKDQERVRDLLIYQDAIFLGIDVAEATNGGVIEPYTYAQLRKLNFIEHDIDDVERVFGDWGTYTIDVLTAYKEYCEEKEFEEKAVLDEIESRDLSPLLFREMERFKSEQQVLAEENKNKHKHNDMASLLSTVVSDDEKIRRYKKYNFIKELLNHRDSYVGSLSDTEDRAISLTLGFSVHTGRIYTTSFSQELYKAGVNLIRAEIELAAGADFDYIFPEARDLHLKQIRDLSRQPPILSLKDATVPFHELRSDEYYVDITDEKIIVGNSVLQEYLKHNTAREKSVRKIGELLLQDHRLKVAELNPYQYKNWRKEDYIKYGKWLLSIVSTDNRRLTARVLSRAHKLNLGPGIDAIVSGKQFNSLDNFYKELGMNTSPRGRFDHWSDEDWIEWIRVVSKRYENKLTEKELRENSVDYPDEPTLKMVKMRGGIQALKESSGLATYHPRLNTEICITRGVEFYKRNHRLPRKRDFEESDLLPSYHSIYKYCGNIPSFRQQIKEALNRDGLLLAA